MKLPPNPLPEGACLCHGFGPFAGPIGVRDRSARCTGAHYPVSECGGL